MVFFIGTFSNPRTKCIHCGNSRVIIGSRSSAPAVAIHAPSSTATATNFENIPEGDQNADTLKSLRACSLSSIDSRIQVILAALHNATQSIAGQARPDASEAANAGQHEARAPASDDAADSDAGAQLAPPHIVPVAWRIIAEGDGAADIEDTSDEEGMLADSDARAAVQVAQASARIWQLSGGSAAQGLGEVMLDAPEEFMLTGMAHDSALLRQAPPLRGSNERVNRHAEQGPVSNRPSDWWLGRPGPAAPDDDSSSPHALSQLISYCESRLAREDDPQTDSDTRHGPSGTDNEDDALNADRAPRSDQPQISLPPEPLSRPAPSAASHPAVLSQQEIDYEAGRERDSDSSVCQWLGYHSSVTQTPASFTRRQGSLTFAHPVTARPLPPIPTSENQNPADAFLQASRVPPPRTPPRAASRLRDQLRECNSQSTTLPPPLPSRPARLQARLDGNQGDHNVEQFRTLFTDEVYQYQVRSHHKLTDESTKCLGHYCLTACLERGLCFERTDWMRDRQISRTGSSERKRPPPTDS